MSGDEPIGMPPGSLGGLAYDALTIARDGKSKAEQALREIESHEDVCAERYKNINEKLEMLFKVIAWAGGAAFLLVMGLLGFLAKTQFESISALQKATLQRTEILERTQPMPPQVIIQRAPGQPEIGATVEQQQP